MTAFGGSPRVRDWVLFDVPVITPRTTVATALRLLREHALPALPVRDGERVAGVVDERGLLRLTPSEATTLDAYELHGVLAALTVARIVQPAAPVAADALLQEAAAQMIRHKLEALPVDAGRGGIGLLPWTAALAGLVEETAQRAPLSRLEPSRTEGR